MLDHRGCVGNPHAPLVVYLRSIGIQEDAVSYYFYEHASLVVLRSPEYTTIGYYRS